MQRIDRDEGLDTLLDLDGQVFFLDADGRYWVKFEVRRCAVTPERPHGLRYALTMHERSGKRLVGFDNAHAVGIGSGPSRRVTRTHDHLHRFRKISAYEYKDAASLVADFWSVVDSVLGEMGIS